MLYIGSRGLGAWSEGAEEWQGKGTGELGSQTARNGRRPITGGGLVYLGGHPGNQIFTHAQSTPHALPVSSPIPPLLLPVSLHWVPVDLATAPAKQRYLFSSFDSSACSLATAAKTQVANYTPTAFSQPSAVISPTPVLTSAWLLPRLQLALGHV